MRERIKWYWRVLLFAFFIMRNREELEKAEILDDLEGVKDVRFDLTEWRAIGILAAIRRLVQLPTNDLYRDMRELKEKLNS